MNDVVRIPLTRGYEALVDATDAAELSAFAWFVHVDTGGRAYALRRGEKRRQTVQMHRQLMAPEPGLVVDHINGDTLDNRRANLRVCTNMQNIWNSRGKSVPKRSRFKGVWYCGRERHWRARIGAEGQRVQLGRFPTDVAAARAYDAAAKLYHGEFARTNADLGLYDVAA